MQSSLKTVTTVTEAQGTCGETIRSQYNRETLTVPQGYEAVGFRSPNQGETYIAQDGAVATAFKGFRWEPYVIVRSTTPKISHYQPDSAPALSYAE